MTAYAAPAAAPTDVLGKRVVAVIVDWLIAGAFSTLLVLILGQDEQSALEDCLANTDVLSGGTVCGDYAGVFTPLGERYVTGGALTLYSLLNLAYLLVVYLWLTGSKGFTPGKAILGLRVVDPQGQPPGLGKATIRFFGTFIDLLPYCIPFLVGFLVANSSPTKQRLADKWAGTYVVDAGAAGQPVPDPQRAPQAWAAPGSQPPFGQPPMAGAAPPPPPGGATAAPQAPPAPPGGSEPQWDADRSAWISYDAASQQWRRFQADGSWGPLDP